MIGFNRRFSPLTQKIKNVVGSGPMTMIYRINAGAIPKDTWIQDIEVGGGRILGEACHFIDYLTYLEWQFTHQSVCSGTYRCGKFK